MTGEMFASLGHSLTAALITGDFALYRSVLTLPLRIVPRGGEPYTLVDIPGLERDFHLYVDALRTAGVTDIYRQFIEARPEGAGGFRVFCTVHILSRATRVTDPFGSEMLLVPTEAGPRIAEIVSTSEHIDWTLGRRPLGPGSGLI